MNLMDVEGETVASYRIWYDTRDEVSDNSCPTRAAIDMAATLRGCVMPIIPGFSVHKVKTSCIHEIYFKKIIPLPADPKPASKRN